MSEPQAGSPAHPRSRSPSSNRPLEEDLLICLSMSQLACDSPRTHHQDPVGHRQEFRHLRREHQDTHTAPAEIIQQSVYVQFGTNVDPTGRLIYDQHSGSSIEPPADYHLLLAAAAQAGDAGFNRRSADPKCVDPISGAGHFLSVGKERPPTVPIQIGNRQVLAHREWHDQCLSFAVAWQVSDAQSPRPMWRERPDRLPMNKELASHYRSDAKQRTRETRPP